MNTFKLALVLVLLTAIFGTDITQAEPSTAIIGILVNASDGTPIPRVTVQMSPSGKTSITNDDGRFRLLSDAGDQSIKFSHVAYQSLELKLSGSNDLGAVALTPALHVIRGLRVYERSYDRAQAIIIEAIRRKEEILSRINNYKNDAYLKMVIRDESVEDSSRIFLITESQTTVYWQAPDKYKEILTARKSSANINVENTIVGVGEMLNFNKNRIDLNEYQIVSPTAKDALEYYNYYLLDTIRSDNRTRYVLEVEPKNQLDPLFAGTIHIIDSTYDVVMVDVGFNQAVRLPMITDLRYQQEMAQFESTYWVPVQISFGGLVKFKIPFPGIPSKLSFEYLASLYSFEFNQPFSDGIFDEYEFEIAKTADDIDSVAWNARQSVPLTAEEVVGYARIDSVENLPVPLGEKIFMGVGGMAALMMGAAENVFHFNRVEGPYFGLGGSSRKLLKNTRLWGGAGYSDNLNGWQYYSGFRTRLSKKMKLHLSAEIKEKITKRPSVTTGSSYGPTFMALAAKYDPFNYYMEKGFRVSFDFKPIRHNRLSFSINSYDQSSESVNNSYSLFSTDNEPRINPKITDGKLRSIEATWRFDSRKLFNNKGVDSPGYDNEYFTIELISEYSSPDFLESDFHFTRYSLAAHLQASLLGSSKTELNVALGYSENSLPAQRFFGVDFGVGVIMSERGYNTIGDSLFFGDRIASAYLIHDLGRVPFARVPVPLLNKIPFGLMIHGGAFWSSFEAGTTVPTGNHRSAVRPYSEAGFTLYNLTPFMAPMNLALGITWQLSDYDTSDWEVHIGFKL